jgi:hypothetical protein
MGGVALGFGIFAAFAMAIACCGPNPVAKLTGAALFANWALSNLFNLNLAFYDTTVGWSYLDIAMVAILTPVWMRWPSLWLGVIVAASWAQIAFHFGFLLGERSYQDAWNSTLINNLLFAIELAFVTGPTLTRERGRMTSVSRTRWARRRPRPGKPHLRLVA